METEEKTKVKPIIYVPHGIGTTYADRIELNINLKKYPYLRYAVLQHELGHSQDGQYHFKDTWHDFKSLFQKYNWELIPFMFKHPGAMKQFNPLSWNKKTKTLSMDYTLILIYFLCWIFWWIIFF